MWPVSECWQSADTPDASFGLSRCVGQEAGLCDNSRRGPILHALQHALQIGTEPQQQRRPPPTSGGSWLRPLAAARNSWIVAPIEDPLYISRPGLTASNHVIAIVAHGPYRKFLRSKLLGNRPISDIANIVVDSIKLVASKVGNEARLKIFSKSTLWAQSRRRHTKYFSQSQKCLIPYRLLGFFHRWRLGHCLHPQSSDDVALIAAWASTLKS
jgi:hypothetical protein